jgi:hypothetical protein
MTEVNEAIHGVPLAAVGLRAGAMAIDLGCLPGGYIPARLARHHSTPFRTGRLHWMALYGSAGRAFDVRWERTPSLGISRLEDGGWRTDFMDQVENG